MTPTECACQACDSEATETEFSPYMDDFCDDCTMYRHDIAPHAAAGSVGVSDKEAGNE